MTDIVNITKTGGAIAASAHDIDTLWRRQVELIAEAKALRTKIHIAEAALPEWARSGPKSVRHDGTFGGATVGWPIAKTLALPTDPGVIFLARPSLADLRKAFERRVAAEPERRAEWRALYRRRVTETIDRIREQRAERDRYGLPAVQAADEVNFEQRSDNRERIEAAPPSINSAAALLLLDIEDGRDQTVALRHLRPALTGLLADHVDMVLTNPTTSEVELPFVV